jgi:hypothetical protein
MFLRDNIDPGVSAPPAGPFIPQPNPMKLPLVHRIIHQEPLADVLELLAFHSRIAREPVKQCAQGSHNVERR